MSVSLSAATATARAISRRSARSPATCRGFNAATATRWVTTAAGAQSPLIGRASNAPTAMRKGTRIGAARTHRLRLRVAPVAMVVGRITLAVLLLRLAAVAMLGVLVEVMPVRVVVGRRAAPTSGKDHGMLLLQRRDLHGVCAAHCTCRG